MADSVPPPPPADAAAPPPPPPTTGGRRKTAWMTHVKATMRAHKGLKLKQVLKLAKKTYKKTAKRGGGAGQPVTPHPYGSMSGARRRKTRRSRRGGMDE